MPAAAEVRFTFDDEQLALRDGVRSFLEKECTPEAIRASWASDTGRSAERWRALGDLGVLGIGIAEAQGGMGLDDTWGVLLHEEAGRAALPEPLGIAAVAAGLLTDAASAGLQQQWLPRLAAGEARVAVALDGDEFVDDVHVADLVLVARDTQLHAITPEGAHATAQPSLDRSRRLFSIAPDLSDTTLVSDDAAEAFAAARDRRTVCRAGALLGTAAKLIEMARNYAIEREQFGVPIGSFQAVKHHLATALVRTEFARPAVYRAAWSVANAAHGRHEHAQMALTLAGQAAHVAARTALQAHGAIGYTDEHDLHLWLRSALNPAYALR